MTSRDQESETLSRRRVLQASGATAGVLAVGGVAASGTVLAGRRGGRALVDGVVRRNEPFTVDRTGTEDRGASCMSGDSAEQTYVVYDVDYCNDGVCVMYVHPDEAPVDDGGVYEFRSPAKDCRDGSSLLKTSFGPSKQRC